MAGNFNIKFDGNAATRVEQYQYSQSNLMHNATQVKMNATGEEIDYGEIENFDYENYLSEKVEEFNLSDFYKEQEAKAQQYKSFLENTLQETEREKKELEDKYFNIMMVDYANNNGLISFDGYRYATLEDYIQYYQGLVDPNSCIDKETFSFSQDIYSQKLEEAKQNAIEQYQDTFDNYFKQAMGMSYQEYQNRWKEINNDITILKSVKYELVQKVKEYPYLELSSTEEFLNYKEIHKNDISYESIRKIVTNYVEKNYTKTYLGTSYDVSSTVNVIMNQFRYDLLSEDDKIMCYYLFEKEGVGAVYKYVSAIEDRLNRVAGEREAAKFIASISKNGKIDVNLWNSAKTAGKGVVDGIENFGEGLLKVFMTDGMISSNQYGQMYVLEALASSKILTGTYQFNINAGNMIPSITVSAIISAIATPGAGSIVGSSLMGLSAGGNAKNQALVDGNSLVESSIYGGCIGLSETTLGYFLGRMPGLSKTSEFTLKNLFLEGIEEFSQEWIDAGLQVAILKQDVDWSKIPEQSVSAFIMGVLMAGLFEGGQSGINLIVNNVTYNINIQRTLEYMKNHSELTMKEAFLKSNDINASSNQNFSSENVEFSSEKHSSQAKNDIFKHKTNDTSSNFNLDNMQSLQTENLKGESSEIKNYKASLETKDSVIKSLIDSINTNLTSEEFMNYKNRLLNAGVKLKDIDGLFELLSQNNDNVSIEFLIMKYIVYNGNPNPFIMELYERILINKGIDADKVAYLIDKTEELAIAKREEMLEATERVKEEKLKNNEKNAYLYQSEVNFDTARFLARICFPLEEINNSLLQLVDLEKNFSLINKYKVTLPVEKSTVSIADIVGYNYRDKGGSNLLKNFSYFFDSRLSDTYHTRSLSLLDLTVEDAIEKLELSFKREPLILEEFPNAKFRLSSGFHRYSVLRTLYCLEMVMAKGDKVKEQNIYEKYKIPAMVHKIDYFHTYTNYIFDVLKIDEIAVIRKEQDGYGNETGRFHIGFKNGIDLKLTYDEMALYIENLLEQRKDTVEVKKILETSDPLFQSFLQNIRNIKLRGEISLPENIYLPSMKKNDFKPSFSSTLYSSNTRVVENVIDAFDNMDEFNRDNYKQLVTEEEVYRQFGILSREAQSALQEIVMSAYARKFGITQEQLNQLPLKYRLEIEKFLTETSTGRWIAGLSGEELESVNSYTGASNENINIYLNFKGGSFYNETMKRNVQRIDSALSKFYLEEDTMFWRGTSFVSFTNQGITDYEGLKALVGKQFNNLGYMSSSSILSGSKVSSSPIVLKIYAPKGTPGAYIENITAINFEYEFLFSRGTAMKIENVFKQVIEGEEKIVVEARVIGNIAPDIESIPVGYVR